jgi:hypothetical protein
MCAQYMRARARIHAESGEKVKRVLRLDRPCCSPHREALTAPSLIASLAQPVCCFFCCRTPPQRNTPHHRAARFSSYAPRTADELLRAVSTLALCKSVQTLRKPTGTHIPHVLSGRCKQGRMLANTLMSENK